MARMETAVFGRAQMDEQATPYRLGKWSLVLIIVILSGGIFLRAWPTGGLRGVGFDEGTYSTYVAMAQKDGLWNYGHVVRAYIKSQAKRPDAIVPATRVGFLVPAAAVAEITGLKPLAALHAVSLASSILLLLATAMIGFRQGGYARMLVLTSLMAVAPLQIHLAQRSLIDGYFAFWAVLCAWFLWENLESPRQKGWLAAYGFSLFALVLTKENAAFVFLALIIVSAAFALYKLGRVSLPLVLVSVIAPAFAVMCLAVLAGGAGEWIAFYRSFVQKSATLSYPIRFQDGPWYRYLVDFTLLSPCVVALALGALLQLRKESKPDIFWSLFLGVSFAAMSSVPYGMSLRFAAYWDLPLRWLAASQLLQVSRGFERRWALALLTGSILFLASVDLFQYWRYFVHGAIYDPVTFELLRASKLIK
jgi:4-amino-4-deoxy-L-arabinose transferase-like glycosyltransferase